MIQLGEARRVAREVGRELAESFTEAKKYVGKRLRRPQRVGGQAPLAFAFAPPQYLPARPVPVKRRRKKMKQKIIYVERRR